MRCHCSNRNKMVVIIVKCLFVMIFLSYFLSSLPLLVVVLCPFCLVSLSFLIFLYSFWVSFCLSLRVTSCRWRLKGPLTVWTLLFYPFSNPSMVLSRSCSSFVSHRSVWGECDRVCQNMPSPTQKKIPLTLLDLRLFASLLILCAHVQKKSTFRHRHVSHFKLKFHPSWLFALSCQRSGRNILNNST